MKHKNYSEELKEYAFKNRTPLMMGFFVGFMMGFFVGFFIKPIMVAALICGAGYVSYLFLKNQRGKKE